MIEVSAGVIDDRRGRILICRRGEGRRNAHLWEFPGGKREAGESAADCLRRELLEELHLPVYGVEDYATGEEGGIRFTFLTAHTDATPVLTEHEDARFVAPRELLAYPFCPADVPVAQKLALSGVKHCIWDFDGTLMDTYPAMVRAFVTASQDAGVTITPERTLTLMKNCLQHCCETVERESGVPAMELRRRFRQHEAGELQRGIPLLEGMEETLRTLHGMGLRHHVATHRSIACRELLERAGVGDLFTGYVTEEDSLPRKPAPDMLQHLMQRQGLRPEECVMIGDRPLDTQSGCAAGMLSILLDTEDRFPEGPCDLRIASPLALLKLLSPRDGRKEQDVL